MKKVLLGLVIAVMMTGGVFANIENDPIFKTTFECSQIFGKNIYSDGEIENISLDFLPITVVMDRKKLKIGSRLYSYESGILYPDGNKKNVNILFTANDPGFIKTQTVSFTMNLRNEQYRSDLIHMIYTEPAIGNNRSFIRTSIYNCVNVG